MFNYTNQDGKTKVGKIVAHSIILLVVIVLVLSSFKVITAGHRGVKLTLGAVSNTVLGEGLHLKVPFVQKIVSVDVRTQKVEVEALSYSKDIQTVDAKIALNFHILPEGVNKLYQEVGLGYNDNIIQPAIQESVKAATAQFTAQDLIEQRPLVKEEIKTFLKDRLLNWKIVVDEFSINNFDFSNEYEKAVEAKQVAQQDALTAKNKLEQVKFEAEQRVASAEAEARAIQIQAEAITQQGGKEYVNLKAVERWNGVLPIQMIPNGTLPFIDLTK